MELPLEQTSCRIIVRHLLSGALRPCKQDNMYAGGQAKDANDVEAAVAAYGAAPGGQAMMKSEAKAAAEAAASGIYVTFQSPNESECCRVQSNSSCLCGHALKSHEAPKGGGSRMKPPACTKCACSKFRYAPTRPEECGQWWLPRRRDFNIKAWRARVRKSPHEYACLNCNAKIPDHETVFETERARRNAGRPVGDDFAPLAATPQLQQLVLGDKARRSLGTTLHPDALADPDARRDPRHPRDLGRDRALLGVRNNHDLEELAATGAISAAEYHRQITGSAAVVATPAGGSYLTNMGVAPPPRGRGAYVRRR